MSDNRGAQALRREIEKQGKQADLAERVGISQSQISRLAAGEKTPKLLEDALKLRDELNIALEWWDQPAETEPSPSAEPAA